MAEHANDPEETQIQYDLYRIPFNKGKGGKATPIAGASEDGMSNNFPKVSPDGRWIVFVQCRNGQLMRPDRDRKSTRLNSSHLGISYAVFCLKKKKENIIVRFL